MRKGLGGAILAFFLLSLGGLLLHVRIHLLSDTGAIKLGLNGIVPVVFGIVNTFVLPLMFLSRKTASWAFLITVLTVIAGTAGMAYFSATDPRLALTANGIILHTTLPDILVLWSKVGLGYAILRLVRRG